MHSSRTAAPLPTPMHTTMVNQELMVDTEGLVLILRLLHDPPSVLLRTTLLPRQRMFRGEVAPSVDEILADVTGGRHKVGGMFDAGETWSCFLRKGGRVWVNQGKSVTFGL